MYINFDVILLNLTLKIYITDMRFDFFKTKFIVHLVPAFQLEFFKFVLSFSLKVYQFTLFTGCSISLTGKLVNSVNCKYGGFSMGHNHCSVYIIIRACLVTSSV